MSKIHEKTKWLQEMLDKSKTETIEDENRSVNWMDFDGFSGLYQETLEEYNEHCEYAKTCKEWNYTPNCTFEEMFYFRIEEILGLVI